MSLPLSENHYEQLLEDARKFIVENDRFLVVSHVHPDGDAIGSMLAVGWLLERLGKSYRLANEDLVPAKFDYLWQSASVVAHRVSGLEGEYSHVIAVDCADFSRIGSVRDNIAAAAAVLNIDHHPTNDNFGAVNVVKSDAAATAEIVYDLAKRFDLSWDRAFAECLYTGLITDTGGFRYANTTPKTLRAAAELLERGVEGNLLAERLLERMSYRQTLLLKKALAGLSFSPDRKIAWISVTAADMAETEADGDDTDGLVNYPRNIEGVEVGILFKEQNANEIKVSLRSAGRADVSLIAKSFGGGGHARAAGCTLKCLLGEAIERTVKEVGLALK